jgi:hypothetical protein
MPAALASVSPEDVRPLALNTVPARTPCQRACGSSAPIRSAANHEYGDIAPK